MKVYRAASFASLYKYSLMDLIQNPEYETRPRELSVKENTNVALVLENPLSCLYKNPVRSSQKKYVAAEMLWYFMGRNDVAFIKKYAKFWESIQNEDGTANSSYGNLLFTQLNEHGFSQYQWALMSLQKDKDSRQAIMHFNLPSHQYITNKDFVCTMYGIFQIRNNRLNFTVSMRSNDVVWGLPTDVAFFTVLQNHLCKQLRSTYPDLRLGTYTHIANSFHIYEHHFDLINRMLDVSFEGDSIPGVNELLVDSCGDPTKAMRDLFYNFSSSDFTSTDPLISWILENIK